jgi:hypothetical protein
MVSTPTQHLRTLAAFATHLVKLEMLDFARKLREKQTRLQEEWGEG